MAQWAPCAYPKILVLTIDDALSAQGEKNTLTYTNVACGQVFVCSGQSNMVRPLQPRTNIYI